MARLSNEVLNTASLARAVTPFGLNLIGVASVASYDAQVGPGRRLGRHLRGAESAIVVGNGGGAFWSAYRRFCAARPAHEDRRDPMDDFTREIVETALAPLVGDAATHILYPFGFAEDGVSFTRLAELAGLGRPSLLGVLVHPVYGPWIALRAAILVRERLEAPRPADGFDPAPRAASARASRRAPAAPFRSRASVCPAAELIGHERTTPARRAATPASHACSRPSIAIPRTRSRTTRSGRESRSCASAAAEPA
jgi:hypothetical protein